ncbi:NO-inducible flavohemoprotein [Olivibacter ginsenosidimutans]|uniref:nitric oxide dioxygenase n=1 Tax=Olivibacter ginsenosidimutans TaxID=1176537 RepID=A0ABP9B9J7_9SPHI
MLSSPEIALIKATVPILREHGVALTQHFYQRMFRLNPELKNIFNMGNQQNGKQQTALAMSVLAYAEHIENPSVLFPVLQHIGDKHTSLQIKPEQYDLVGNHLIASIKEVLGDQASDDLLQAWTAAYKQLAKLMINLEQQIYQQKESQQDGWKGWRSFTVKKKVIESDEITSFYLYPTDGQKIVLHKPGQYLSIKLFLPQLGISQPRQYSISSAPNNTYYRISVKKEIDPNRGVKGTLSNHLHDAIQIGSTVEASIPAGNFTFNTESVAPLILLSGGVGQTPFISMVEHLTNLDHTRSVKWIHACRSENVHAFKEEMNKWQETHEWFEHIVFYEHDDGNNTSVKRGRLNIEQVKDSVLLPEAEYYLCGPKPFIEKAYADLIAYGVDHKHIFFEEFGPQTVQLN